MGNKLMLLGLAIMLLAITISMQKRYYITEFGVFIGLVVVIVGFCTEDKEKREDK